jgi:hypothetical protein
VHLSHYLLRAGVDAFGASVVVGQGEAGVHSGTVSLRPLQKLCRWGRLVARTSAIQWVSLLS